ncbi:MAG: glycosyltransferase [Butyrivibrio sp.]|nr:glycosyltransferase [Butyrivibrio sp.]
MKIIIQFIPSLVFGGAETIVKEYTRLLDKNKYKIYVLLLEKKNNSVYEQYIEKLDNVELISIGDILEKDYRISTIDLFNRLYYKFHRNAVIEKIIKNIKPDVIHVHLELLRYLTFLTDTDIKIFYTVHSEVKAIFSEINALELYGWSVFRNVRRIRKRITHYKEKKAAEVLLASNNLTFIALHKRMKKELQDLFYTDKVTVLKNGIDFNRFKKREKINYSKRKEIGIFDDRFIIGNVGWLHQDKNPFFMIDIAHAMMKKKINVHLLLIGSGKLKDDLINYAMKLELLDRITILSDRSDIPELLSMMNVFVFPALYEGLPVSLVEAQAVGLKCVVAEHITSEVFLSDKYYKVSLNESLDTWCSIIYDELPLSVNYNDINMFDMNKVVKVLEGLYDE